jgi:hypothetical protein
VGLTWCRLLDCVFFFIFIYNMFHYLVILHVQVFI